MKIVALDFETADRGPDSACALALVAIENGAIVDKMSFLVRPPRQTFEFTYIHGITSAQVRNKPLFAERIPDIEDFIRDASFLVAHNAAFDRKVLYNCYSVSAQKHPTIPFSCTVRLARTAWQIRPTTLPDVCSHLGIFLNHHDALSDALACARIAIAAQVAGVPIESGRLGPHTYRLMRSASDPPPAPSARGPQTARKKARPPPTPRRNRDALVAVQVTKPSKVEKKGYAGLLVALIVATLLVMYFLRETLPG